jgi:putative membrane protein
MPFLILKSLHIIFVITWFAGLFYIVRLFIYHVESEQKPHEEKTILQNQFKIMEKRLWYFITWPSAILTLIFGPSLLFFFQPILQKPWLLLKLFFVFLLFLYHLSCHKLYKELQKNQIKYTSTQLRVWNEVATLLLFSIVFLVVLKSLVSVGQGLLALFFLGALMSLAIKIYKKNRTS